MALTPLKLGSIRPEGWLREQLLLQANGLGGHLDEVWPDVGPNSGWIGGTGESWERGPYFVDGLVPLAWQLEDQTLQSKALRFIDWTLGHAQSSGFFGPGSNNDWWPRMVMLKALCQYEEASGDDRVIPVMERYFDYCLRELPGRPLRDWGRYRWQDQALSVIWLYTRNGNPKLMQLARLLAEQGYDWRAQFTDFRYTFRCTPEYLGLNTKVKFPDRSMQTHGVNNAMALKVSPVHYLLDGNPEDKTGILRQFAALDRWHGLPNGMFSADEHFAGPNPVQGIELCAVVEAMFSLEQALAITGIPELGDRLERIAFNALPGTFTDDMWAHQYNQEPNQVEVSLHRRPWTTDGPESNIYGLAPNFGCCTANFHQGWPKFTASLWMQTPDAGIAAVAYAPSTVRTRIGPVPVTIREETNYPFREEIRFHVDPASPHTFPLKMRIPGWAHGAQVRVNQEPGRPVEPGSFAEIRREWTRGDGVTLTLPMPARTSRWYRDSVAVERGPVVYSLPIGASWLKLVDRGQASDWQAYPASAWNYALALNPDQPDAALTVHEAPMESQVFTLAAAPVRIEVPAFPVPGWREEDGVADSMPASPVPVDNSKSITRISLVPYAAAKLRITAFPHGIPGAHRQADDEAPEKKS
ncbi:MAG TPA: beta-L-arabinofuranosidase domain-containing protein [Acidobacteriaceae bacterium]|nr:beta-L-arabinofuranosidase domain-containing protein [Acidobacteriaceae bacterium]